MATYLVIYDLLSPGQDYSAIHAKIKTYKTWARPTESTWIIVTTKSAEEIRDDIENCIDENYRLLIVKSGTESAWTNLRCSNEWLQKNL
ncbi:MAG: hypothetical protein ACOY4B_09485 [Pseudomonadota bacterium]|uniref:hypothetical protein n=1 Tax=uncultured Sphingomonas sp. TaxID=158754 RepID=UPI0030F99275